MKQLEQARKFVEYYETARKIANVEDVSWESKYDLIFHPAFQANIRDTGIDFPRYDYDTSYQDDVMGFVDGMGEKAEELRKILEAVQ